jgi:mutator protein MutT
LTETVLDCVAFVLRDGDRVLVEQRRMDKKLLPGALALPGGHVEPGEALDEALAREAMEEMGIVCVAPRWVCALLHHADEIRRIHYYLVESWQGAIESHEAEALIWLPIAEAHRLDIEIDRIALDACLDAAHTSSTERYRQASR